MTIKIIHGGMLGSVCYLIGSQGKAALIDAGVPGDRVIQAAKEANLEIEKIILTHGHIDHIHELDDIVHKTHAKVYIHIDDEMYLGDERLNLSTFIGEPKAFGCDYQILRDDSSLSLEALELKIIHTPGHTAGSICIAADDVLFSGDTLFSMGYGRIDLPNGNFESLYHSIMDKLFKLPDNTVVYPGHGGSTTIGIEKENNPIRAAIEY